MNQSNLEFRFELQRPGFSFSVDLSLPGQGISVIFGASGSGKTTLLRLIAGLERSVGGYCRCADQLWQHGQSWVPPHRRQVAYVFQGAQLFNHLNVLENVRYGQRRLKASAIQLAPICELLGITALLQRRVSDLSGGEAQRVAIARALLTDPRILLLDEALSGLDSQRKAEILPYLERLHQTLAIPILYITHDHAELARLADYLVVIDQGRVQSAGVFPQILSAGVSPLVAGPEAGVVLTGQVAQLDQGWNLAQIDLGGAKVWMADPGVALGHSLRVRILARDVALSRSQEGSTSIQNQVPGLVEHIGPDHHPALSLVKIRLGSQSLFSRLSCRAVNQLQLKPGDQVYALVKTVALVQ